jgi:hypothetical protein
VEIGLGALDWRAPWLEPWRVTGQDVAQRVLGGATLHDALNAVCAGSNGSAWIPGQAGKNRVRQNGAATPIRFVAQQELPAGRPYEQFVFDTGCCPVRPGLHDFFNGLCWLRFPQTKARLNELQAAQIGKSGVLPVRGALRDAVTLFDENAALLDAPQPLWEALAARDWPRLFVELRPLWQQAGLLLFGHALLEKLTQPRKAITAHVRRLAPGLGSVAAMDAWLAGDLTPEKLVTKPFAPLPVLGRPGWWPANQDPAFYNDAVVFRRAAQSRKTIVPSAAAI